MTDGDDESVGAVDLWLSLRRLPLLRSLLPLLLLPESGSFLLAKGAVKNQSMMMILDLTIIGFVFVFFCFFFDEEFVFCLMDATFQIFFFFSNLRLKYAYLLL